MNSSLQQEAKILAIFATVWLWFCDLPIVLGQGAVIYAINAGGLKHFSVAGVEYSEDPLLYAEKAGRVKIIDPKTVIFGIREADWIIYQYERTTCWEPFAYQIPIMADGDYALVLQFSESYFEAAGKRLFDVEINGKHMVTNIDIFANAGNKFRPVEHWVDFTIEDGLLWYGRNREASSNVLNGRVPVEFRRGQADFPFINGLYLKHRTADDKPGKKLDTQDENKREMAHEENL